MLLGFLICQAGTACLVYPLVFLYVIDRGSLRPACAAAHIQVNGGRTTKDNGMLSAALLVHRFRKSASRYENLFDDMALPAERNGTW